MNSNFNSKQNKLLQLWFFSKSIENSNLHQLFTETNMYLEENIEYEKAQIVYSKVRSIEQTLKRIRQLDTLIHEVYRYVLTIQLNSQNLEIFMNVEKTIAIKEKAVEKTVFRVLQYNSFIFKTINEYNFILANTHDLSINLASYWSRLHLVLKVLEKRIETQLQSINNRCMFAMESRKR